MDDSFRPFVEECDNFQVRPLPLHSGWPVVLIDTDRDFSFAPIMPLLGPSRTPYSLPSGMSFQNTPL